MKNKYQFYGDPAHGWLKVPLQELYDLGIAQDISTCSYRRKDWAYLEEDYDFATFVDARFPNLDYREINLNHINNHCANQYSKIRDYTPFQPQSKEDYNLSKGVAGQLLKARDWTKSAKIKIQSWDLAALQKLARDKNISLKE